MTESASSDSRGEASLVRVVVVALLPTLLFSIGQGAIIPIIPTVAASMGAGLEFAGFIAGSIMIGQAFGNIPAGPVVSRLGEKWAMVGGAVLAVAGTLVSTFAVTTWMLLAGILIIGFSSAIFGLARHAFLTTYAPLRYRARVLSTLGGTLRAGLFVGPLLSAGIIAATGLAQMSFWIFVACTVLVVVVLLVTPDTSDLARGRGTPTGSIAVADGAIGDDGAVPANDEARAAHKPAPTNVWSALVEHRAVLLRLGVGAGITNLLRGARNVVLPLWALSIGLDDSSTALIIGISGAIDFCLFFTSGWIMDRFGRVWSAVPCMVGLGTGLLVLAFLHDVPGAVPWFVAIAIWLGVCNGIGSGIVMTLGADVAPRRRPAPFLGAWHLITDASSASVPFIVAGVTALFALPATVGTLGMLGLLGAFMMGRWIPRYIARP
ncbi:MFS transporter [Pseudoclavibacter endophyticus]|uniref:MFS transporter n=1 Tax=Pseudoclavibacter endophyticus TaxID=1778590 RepID=A0A6H9WIK9_9MICO|nr:MFS transporter [Pseudoclavibacter endophyticus]KAB1648347.1 MFS transporter [Pseudoclavibacter endophyticus]GGA71862.1 MFS transporter [Pseudoclavibacter endophyticus]